MFLKMLNSKRLVYY